MKKFLGLKKYFSIFAFSFFLLDCGLEQYYYLPQNPQAELTYNDSAIVEIPSIDEYYYATGYSIYYRIYISNTYIPIIDRSRETLTSINSNLYNDYNAIFPSTDPTNETATTAVNTLFKSRNYFELELNGADIKEILSIHGGTLRLEFNKIDYPYASYIFFNDDGPIAMKRSGELISPLPTDDYTFNNSTGLNNYNNSNANANADVSSIPNNISPRYAYVSMYIVAVGMNNELFSAIYSKPTHIGIFKLPD
jgi:hypothetical protein